VPKRTNDFQALIALVEGQLAASGVRVVESEMLADRLTGELREVDVCVHAIVSGKDVTLALVCRDHKRKADQIWIDTLRGKYANLPVDNVIAVARAGFANTARAAAEKARIQTLTLEEATSANGHLIAELPDAALVVAHFPVAANVSLHLVKGQAPIPGDGYFPALGVPLVRGRLFDARDGVGAPLAVVINQKMAATHWPNENPVGRRVRIGAGGANPWFTIVGVVGNVRQMGLGVPPESEMYFSLGQPGLSSPFSWPQYLVVRTNGDPLALAASVRRAV
jgi:hypothetical protein